MKSPSRRSYKNKFQVLHIATIREDQNYQTLQRGTSSWFMTITKLLFFIYSIIHPLLLQKLHGKMKQKLALLWSRINAKNRVFVVPYHILWQRIVIHCIVTVDYGHFSCHHKSRIVLSNQNVYTNELNIVFVVCFLFWRVQNRYKETDVIRSLFYRYIVYNLHRVAHDNGGWRRLSIAVATECCWLKKLSCKWSRT